MFPRWLWNGKHLSQPTRRAGPVSLGVELLEDRTVPSLVLTDFLTLAAPTNGVAVGDLNNNGNPDVVVASGFINPGNGPVASPGVMVQLGNGGGGGGGGGGRGAA